MNKIKDWLGIIILVSFVGWGTSTVSKDFKLWDKQGTQPKLAQATYVKETGIPFKMPYVAAKSNKSVFKWR